jgi:hypothetical protein
MGASDAVPKAVAKVGKSGTGTDYSRDDHQHALDPNLFTEQVNVQQEGVDKGSRQGVNFKAGANITLNVAEDAPNERVNVEIASSGGGGVHDILSATHSDTLAAAVVAGDIIIANATPKWSRLAKGTLNYVLKMGASLPGWGQVDWGELTGKPSTFPPSAHDHLDDHLKPTTIGKIPTTSTPTILYLYTKDYLGDPGSNKFLPEDSGSGYLGDATHFWAGVYANYVNVNGNLVVLSLRDPGAGTHYFSYATSTHSTLRPATADYSYVGTSAYYFNSVYADHVKYKEHSVFDALDDIALVRKIKAHKTEITKKGLPSVDYSTVPDELKAYEPEDIVDAKGEIQQAKGYHDFMDLGALCGLLTGAVKQLADKVDDLQARLKKLEKGG